MRRILFSLSFVALLFIIFSTQAFSQKKSTIDNYFISGSKQNMYDTLALKQAQDLAKETTGIFEKEIEPESYILGPNDEFLISISGVKTQIFQCIVSPEGKLLIPEVGIVELKGKNLAEAYDIIKQKISRVYKSLEVSILLNKIREFKVSISGSVIKSNVVTATAVDRVSEIIERCGGLKNDASLRKIQIIRNEGKEVLSVDLLRFYILGQKESNPTVLGGDHIFVPKVNNEEFIEISGDVPSFRKFEYVKGDSLLTLIKFAGGLKSSSFLDSVELARFQDNYSTTKRTFLNLTNWVDNLNSTSLSGNIPLEPGDRVYIRQLPDWSNSRKVVIAGEVKYPGVYAINKDDSKISDILTRAGGFTDEASVEATVLVRQKEMEKVDREMERLSRTPYSEMSKNERRYFQSRIAEQKGLMAVDFKRIMQNPSADDNIMLFDEDSLFVPHEKNYVNVQGRVNNPGMIIHNPALTYLDYINLAGGFGFRADQNETLIVKSKGEQFLAKDMNYKIETGDNILVPPESEVTFFEVFTTTLTIVAQIVTILGVVLALRKM
ncbi:MAG: SLBB domain-containing protein [Bacteroidota bacterium]